MRADASTADVCTEICGDGITVFTTYDCDDGDNDSGDGCSDICGLEDGWTCQGGDTTNPDACNEICGDGFWIIRDVLTREHQCDDNDTDSGDGCTDLC